MEPPTKRPRFGPAPFEDDDDDPEADELNERPEEVNARRDPNARLERSRAFAALKLKSAFERIFEKYERDFTGIGDEIDLRTGEIVVNNGHVQSLKDAQIGGPEEDDGNSEHAPSEAGSLNDEERILMGRPDNRLSRLALGQIAPPPIPPQIGLPLLFGGAPVIPSMVYPGQVQFGGFPMQYGPIGPLPATDPTWSAPDLPLPSPFVSNGLMSGEVVTSAKKKKARLSLTTASQQALDEDDILLGGFTTTQEGGESGRIRVKQKLLLPRPPSERPAAQKKKRSTAVGPKGVQKSPKPDNARTTVAGKSPEEDDSSADKSPTARPDSNPSGADLTKAIPTPKTQVGRRGSSAQSASAKANGRTGSAEKESSQKAVSEKGALVAVGSPPSKIQGPDSELQEAQDPDVYVNLSDGREIYTRKPRNQTLRVEIVARKPPDLRSFRVLTPEPSEVDSPGPDDAKKGEAPFDEVPAVPGLKSASPDVSPGNSASKCGCQAQSAPTEVFSRNVVDPAYDFSDEDEPAVPRKKAAHSKQRKVTKPFYKASGGNREDEDPVLGEASHGRKLTPDEPHPDADDLPTAQALSPPLSSQLADTLEPHNGEISEPSILDQEVKSLGRKPAEEISNNAASAPNEKEKVEPTGRQPMDGAESSLTLQPSPAPSDAISQPLTSAARIGRPRSKKKRASSSRYSQRDVPGRTSLGQEAEGLSHASNLFDPPFSSEEQPRSNQVHRDGQQEAAPSPAPTAAASTSNHQQPPPAKQPNRSQQTPSTPLKTPHRGAPKRHSQPASSSTTTTTTKKVRKGLLSLLPNDDNDDDDQDELSSLSPIKPAPGSSRPLAIRSSPAAHHVRLGLLATGKVASSSSVSSRVGRIVRTTPSGPRGGGSNKTPAVAAVGGGGGGSGAASDRGPPGTPLSSRTRLGSELVETPGGTMRRCGEGGFRCERDFCFACL